MLHFSTKTTFAALALAAFFTTGTQLRAETLNLTAALDGTKETPPNTTAEPAVSQEPMTRIRKS